MIKAQTLKGFRDFLPREVRRRQYVAGTLKSVFELYGFEPLETPVLEYEEILTGRYGREGEKLMYRFSDLGNRRVAMRYDQTVPLARVVAQFQSEIAFPFKRYQISPVWRAENTQRGRFREFLQCDADIVGTSSPLADAEVIMTAVNGIKKLGFKNFKVLINDRENLSVYKDGYTPTFEEGAGIIRAVDKLKKIGREGVIGELTGQSIPENTAREILEMIEKKKPTAYLQEIFADLSDLGMPQNEYEFSPALARGLDYYTGMIFEIEIAEYNAGSVCGGGRYDNLIGMFTGRQCPAVGFAFGFDRLVEAMEELNLYPANLALSSTRMLITVFSEDLKKKSLELSSEFRLNNINTEVYLGEIKENNPLEKQLKYADQKGIEFVLIIGPKEIEENIVTLKNMKTREQKQVKTEEVYELLK